MSSWRVETLDDVISEVHQDSSNQRNSFSVVIPLTSFANGQLWIVDAAGTSKLPGKHEVLRDFVRGPCRFDPHFKYAVLPWYGRRVTLAAYVPRGVIDSLSAFMSDLSLLGFVLRVFPRVSRQEVNQPKSSSGREIAYV